MNSIINKKLDNNLINKKELFNWDDIINENNDLNDLNTFYTINDKSNNYLNKTLSNNIDNYNNSSNNSNNNGKDNIQKIINKNSHLVNGNKIKFTVRSNKNNSENKIIKNTINENKIIKKADTIKQSIFDKISILNKSNKIINTINEDELETKLDINKINKNSKLCINCNNSLIINYNQAICNNCGFENNNDVSFDNDNSYIDPSYNSSEFINFKITGKNSYGLQKNMLKICSNYDQYRKIHIMKEIYLWNNQSIDFKIPKHIIREGIDMFCKIKEADYVFRKDNKKGVISACLYYTCYNNGIIKTPQEMAKYVGIQEKFHSYGDRVLHDLNDKGIIDIPNKLDSIPKYIDKYFEILSIDKKYKPFVINIINKLEETNVHLLFDSKNNTKCIGTIYLLTQRIPYLKNKITKEMIEKECKISKTTFIRYYKIIHLFYKKIKFIFKRYAIPMPVEWKK
jgi:hypothetical protein